MVLSKKKTSDIKSFKYDRHGTDIVADRGIKQAKDVETIEINLNAIGAGYLFE